MLQYGQAKARLVEQTAGASFGLGGVLRRSSSGGQIAVLGIFAESSIKGTCLASIITTIMYSFFGLLGCASQLLNGL